jgi:hypothetical protein
VTELAELLFRSTSAAKEALVGKPLKRGRPIAWLMCRACRGRGAGLAGA